MIHYKIGNLLDSDAEALVNTVNTVGVMGKGIALQFKNAFPSNYRSYIKACEQQEVGIGKLFVTEEESMLRGKKLIINFPTKTSWRKPSEYEYIEKGLEDLVSIIKTRNIRSLAIPPLGAGNGGLDWNKVKLLLETYLSDLDCEIYVYEPNNQIREVLKKERVKLTPARAMLLFVLYDLVKHGEFVSEFSAEKVAYFLQRFGAEDIFKLEFKPNFYGPYSGKVRHVLYYLNGSYITGYISKDKKPFEVVNLIQEAETEITEFLLENENRGFLAIAEKVKKLLSGFYSPFGLELLSSVDFIRSEKNIKSEEGIINELSEWSTRKKTLFTNQDFVRIALTNLERHLAN
ncbi:MAG: macro domain-containing protein [Acidobacteria bacterium]|nr:macro domain-containing protein [Acidobacteriota bacterium]